VDGRNLDDAAPEVVIRSDDSPAAEVRLHDCRFLGEYETAFAVALHADGLNARLSEVSVTPWDGGGLPGFIDGLAADFRGWAGTRSWTAGHLEVSAAFRSGGHVELRWTIRPRLTHTGWEATLTTWIEGGQHMTGLAAGVRAFLTPDQPAQLRRLSARVGSGRFPPSAGAGPALVPDHEPQSAKGFMFLQDAPFARVVPAVNRQVSPPGVPVAAPLGDDRQEPDLTTGKGKIAGLGVIASGCRKIHA
jgi:hypothetical protein